MNLQKLNVTYEELFELMSFNKTDYYNSQYYNKNDIYIETPTGFTEILGGCVKNDLDMLNIKFENNTECNVAEEHIFSYNNKEEFAKDAKVVDSRKGPLNIVEKTKIGKFLIFEKQTSTGF